MSDENSKVSMLLDIDSFYGESEGRLGPVIKMLCIGFAPLLAWVYIALPIPIWLMIPLEIIWFIRVAMITVGREKQRLAQYRKQLNDDYSSTAELLRIKTIHEDGCVEYTSGQVAYVMLAANGTTYDPLARSMTIRDFFSQIGKYFDIDFYIQNVTEMKSLEQRYNNVKLFVDQEAAKDFIDIIDHNRKVVYSESRLTRIVIVVKGSRNYWTDIRDDCKQAVNSAAARAFKDVHIATRDEVREILGTDIRGYVDIDGELQRKYATHQYYGSKVLYFGDEPKEVAEDGKNEERGFMVDHE